MTVARTVSLALGLIGGIAAAQWAAAPPLVPAVWAASAAGLAVSVWLFRREYRWERVCLPAVVAACALVTCPLGYLRAWQVMGPPGRGSLGVALAGTPPGEIIGVGGRICLEPEWRSSGRGELVIRADRVRQDPSGDWSEVRPARVLLSVRVGQSSGARAHALFAELMHPRAYGYEVTFTARNRESEEPLNPGQFDVRLSMLQSGAAARFSCHVSRVRIVERSRGLFLTELALAAKERFLVTYRQTIRSPASRLVAAATVGSRRAVENITYRGQSVSEMFRHAGVGHVLAVSGLHVSVVSLLLFWMFSSAGIRPRVFVPMQILFLMLFALLTGARPSSVRAVVMNAAILAAFACGRCGLRRAVHVGLALSALLILAVRPEVLFAPSFLLSFGAVLSLVLVAPPLDRWLCRLRGGGLFGFLLWFVGVVITLALFPQVWLSPPTIASALGLLCLSIAAGNRMNVQRPGLWRIGLDRLPAALRLFLGAQLAIQVGMMIPLSAWFFGRFPSAGVLVNLLAIPAIGVLVQLGIITGFLGSIPVAGIYLALPFGAAATLVGDFFFWLAYAGSRLFPFFAVPQPSATWLTAYYAVLGTVLTLPHWEDRVLSHLYRAWRSRRVRRRVGILARLAAVLLVVSPVIALAPRARHCVSVTCVAARQFPILALVATDRRAIVINAGDNYTGGGVLFDVLRTRGAYSVDTAVLCAVHPRAGNEGLAALALKMPVRRCLIPVKPPSADRYLNAIGDDYLREQADSGVGWAIAYREGYDTLLRVLSARGTTVQALSHDIETSWCGLHMTALPNTGDPPRRFAASSVARVLAVRVNGFDWVVVTDALADRLPPAGCDVLVLPDLGYRNDYLRLVAAALGTYRPRAVVISGDGVPLGLNVQSLSADHPSMPFLLTGRNGAVTADFPETGLLRLRSHVTGQTAYLLSVPRRPL